MPELPIKQAFDLALQHHQAGRLVEAEQLYVNILAEQPAHADAMHYLAVVARQTGRHDRAADLLHRAIALRPENADAHYDLGGALADGGRLGEAIAAYRQAIALRPDFPQALSNLGIILQNNGQLDEAIAAHRQAVALNPGLAEAHNNLGVALKARGEFDEAIAAYRHAIALRPQFAEAHNNLGNALKDTGAVDRAIAAYRQAIVLKPDYAEAHNNLGNALRDRGFLDERIAKYRRASVLAPEFAEAHGNLGAALKDAGLLDDAIAQFRQALALKPNHVEAHSNLLYLLHFHPGYGAGEIAKEHRQWNLQHAEPLRKLIQPHANDRDPDRRLRLGYVSPDFRYHAVGQNLLPLFRQHDHRQFEITCYSNVVCKDALTDEFRGHADRWREIVGMSDDEASQQIRDDKIDILIDLALHLANNRILIFARKPAPVQVTFVGYPASTGLTAIDYRLSDLYIDPPGMDESIYSEQTVRLPDTFWCYDPMDDGSITVNSLPALQSGVVTFGCVNNFCKINDAVLSLWARVLNRVERSRLVLLASPGSHRQRTLDRLRHEGIDPARIEFVGQQSRRDYLKTYHRIDLGLDAFPYNGHTTSLDSFWMGVPVVTLVGQTAVARAGGCMLSNLGLTELAGETAEQFVNIAVDWAHDLPRLNDLRSTLRGRMERSPLMDAPRFARNIETAYRAMWRNSCEAARK